MKSIGNKARILILAVFLLTGFLLAGCTDKMSVVTIESPSLLSGRNIQLQIKASAYNPQANPVEFIAAVSLEEIRDAVLKWDPQALVEIQEKGMFISSRNPNLETYDYYYLYKGVSENSYKISDLGAEYHGESDYHLDFLVPVHLLEDYGGDSPAEFWYGGGEAYPMTAGVAIEDVLQFYVESGYYQVAAEGDEIRLTQTFSLNSSGNDRMVNCEIDNPVIIQVRAEGDNTFFSCLVELPQSGDSVLSEDKNDQLNEGEEVRPALNREEALEQMLFVAGREPDEVEDRTILYDIQDRPSYEIMTFLSGGYMICMREYAVVIEVSKMDVQGHPYEGVMENKKYYAGPGNYFYAENGSIYQVGSEKIIVKLENFSEIEGSLQEYARQMGNRISEDDEEHNEGDMRLNYDDIDSVEAGSTGEMPENE